MRWDPPETASPGAFPSGDFQVQPHQGLYPAGDFLLHTLKGERREREKLWSHWDPSFSFEVLDKPVPFLSAW